MIRSLIKLILTLAGNALGLFLAALILNGFHINGAAFFVAIIIFTIIAAIAEWGIGRVADNNAEALRSSSALLTTFIALVLTALVSSGLSIDGLDTWVFATLIVWLTTLLAGFVLPLIFLKNRAEDRR